MDETKDPSADQTNEAPIPPVDETGEDVNLNWKEDAGALNDVEADRVDSVLAHVATPARNALKRNGYTLERVAMTRDNDLAAIRGVSEGAIRAIRQRVPFADGSDS